MVLENYPQLRYCRIKTKQKNPFEKNWPEKPYTFEQIQKFIPKENYGVLCGYGDLIVIDSDKPELQEAVETTLPKTHRVKTGGGGMHNYFFCPEFTDKIVLDNGQHWGEVQGRGSQVVGAGSTHPNGKRYEKQGNNQIATITKSDLFQAIAPFIQSKDLPTSNKPSPVEYQDIIEKALQHWKEGDRQNKALLLAGYCRKTLRLGLETVKNIIATICARSGDDEVEMRLRAVDETFKKDEKDIKGISGLQELMLPQEIQTTQSRKNYTLRTYKDYEHLKKDKSFLVQDIIYPKTVTMLYSPPGEFKSIIALSLAFAIATGKTWMGKTCKKYPVLYCDKENNDQTIKARAEGLFKGMGLKRKSFPLYFLPRAGDFKDPKFYIWLMDTITTNKIKLIVFDTLHRFSDYEENSSDDMNRLYTTIFQPLQEMGVSVLFLHHSTKPKQNNSNTTYRGTGDFLGMVDTAYSVHRMKKTNTFTIENEKARGGEIETMRGEILFEDDIIKLRCLNQDIPQEQKLTLIKSVTTQIKEYASKTYPNTFKRKDFLVDCDIKGFDYGATKNVDRALRWLVDNTVINKDESGKYCLISR